MRGVLVLVVAATAGCELVFPLEATTPLTPDGPPVDPPKRPLGCSPMSLLTDGFTDSGPLGRPWIHAANGAVTTATETGDSVEVLVMNGFDEEIAEPFLELREQELSVVLTHVDGVPTQGDRSTLDLLTEDGVHRLSYGLVADAAGQLRLVAEYKTIDQEGTLVTTIGSAAHTGNEHPIELHIRQTGEVTTFLSAVPGETPVERLTTALAPLDWIKYMRPILRTDVGNNLNKFVYRSFNGGGAPIGEACPGSTITETFEEGLSTEWQQVTPNDHCAIAIDGGPNLRMSFADDGDVAHICQIHTSTVYNLRDHHVDLAIFEVVPGEAALVNLEFELETRTNRARFRFDAMAGVLQAVYGPDEMQETMVGAMPHNITSQTVWRLSGTDDDRLVFEVGDGQTFRPLGATQLGDLGKLDVARVKVTFRGAGEGAGGVASFRSITSQ